MSKSILLADDSVTIRKVVELTFMDEDYELDAVGSGEEALERLAEGGHDLVIADVHMPGVTGYDVCRRVKEESPETPVLLLVGTFEPFDPADVDKSGGDRYLKKPFDSQELLGTVRQLLAGPAPAAAAGTEGDEPEATSAASPEPEAAPDQPAGAAEAPRDESLVDTAQIPDEEAVAEAAGAAPQATAATPVAAPPSEPAAVADAAGPVSEAPDLSAEAIDKIARRVAELLGEGAVREVAWEVVPDLAEVVIKERLRELESQVE